MFRFSLFGGRGKPTNGNFLDPLGMGLNTGPKYEQKKPHTLVWMGCYLLNQGMKNGYKTTWLTMCGIFLCRKWVYTGITREVHLSVVPLPQTCLQDSALLSTLLNMQPSNLQALFLMICNRSWCDIYHPTFKNYKSYPPFQIVYYAPDRVADSS